MPNIRDVYFVFWYIIWAVQLVHIGGWLVKKSRKLDLNWRFYIPKCISYTWSSVVLTNITKSLPDILTRWPLKYCVVVQAGSNSSKWLSNLVQKSLGGVANFWFECVWALLKSSFLPVVYLGRTWVSPTLASWTVEFSSVIRRSVNASLTLLIRNVAHAEFMCGQSIENNTWSKYSTVL